MPPCSATPNITIDLEAVITGPHEITWDFGDGAGSVYGPTIVNTSTQNQNHTYTSYGTYQIIFTYRDTICDVTYKDTVDFVHTEGQKPSIAAPPIPPIAGCGAPFIANPTGTVGPEIDRYYWSIDGGVYQDSMNLTPNLQILTTGMHTIHFFVETDSSTYCIKKDSVGFTVQVNQVSTFVPVIDFPIPAPCQVTSFDVTADLTGSNITPDSVVWNFEGTPVITNTAVFTHTFSGYGTYPVEIEAFAPNGCGDTLYRDTVIFNIPINLALDLDSIPDIKGCGAPFIANPVANVVSAVDSLFWTLDGGTPIHLNDTTPAISINSAGTHTIWLYSFTSDPRYCINRDSTSLDVSITQLNSVDINIGVDDPPPCEPSTISSYTVDFSANPDRPLANITWDLGDGDTVITVFPFSHTYDSIGTYTVNVIAIDSVCADTLLFTENINYTKGAVLEGLTIPNIFTPNGDGKNDQFEIGFKSSAGVPNPEQYYKYTIEIYNRWGTLLFTGWKDGDKEKLWNGVNEEQSGKEVKEGVYFYILNFESTCSEENKTIDESGHVTIVR